MYRQTLLGFMGGTLCLTTAFGSETIQPTSVTALIGLSTQDDDGAASAQNSGHSHHGAHHGSEQGSEHGPHLRITAGVNLISETDIKDSPEGDGIKWDTGVEFNVAYGMHWWATLPSNSASACPTTR